jgi:hypothetical protein
VEYVIVLKSHDPPSVAPQERIALGIMGKFLGCRVRCAVDFNSQLGGNAGEIDDVVVDRMLPAKVTLIVRFTA